MEWECECEWEKFDGEKSDGLAGFGNEIEFVSTENELVELLMRAGCDDVRSNAENGDGVGAGLRTDW